MIFLLLFFLSTILEKKKQDTVARSSVEAESHAMAHTTGYLLWLRWFDHRFHLKTPTPFFFAPFILRQIRCFMQEFPLRPNISKFIATTFVENFLMISLQIVSLRRIEAMPNA